MTDDEEQLIEAAAEAEEQAEAEAEAALAAEADAELAGEVEEAAADADPEAAPLTAAQLADPQLKALLEAVIFAAEKPVTLQRMRQLTRVSDMPRLTRLVDEIAADYRERGIVLQQVSGGFQFRTATEYSKWVQQLVAGRPVRLSRAQLETLAIIAYRQPITRPEIDEIRGVDSGATLKLLLERSLIRVLGKKEEPGRPILYGTTREFLDFFSLSDLRELPTLREYSELSPESQEMVRKLGMDAPTVALEPDAVEVVETVVAVVEVDEVEVDAVPAPVLSGAEGVIAAEGSGPVPAAETWS
jgi:segregation and condensation protein B